MKYIIVSDKKLMDISYYSMDKDMNMVLEKVYEKIFSL